MKPSQHKILLIWKLKKQRLMTFLKQLMQLTIQKLKILKLQQKILLQEQNLLKKKKKLKYKPQKPLQLHYQACLNYQVKKLLQEKLLPQQVQLYLHFYQHKKLMNLQQVFRLQAQFQHLLMLLQLLRAVLNLLNLFYLLKHLMAVVVLHLQYQHLQEVQQI